MSATTNDASTTGESALDAVSDFARDTTARVELYGEAAVQKVKDLGRDLKARGELYAESVSAQVEKVRASAADLGRNTVELVRRRPVQTVVVVAGVAAIVAVLLRARRRAN